MFSTIIDTNNNGADALDEVLARAGATEPASAAFANRASGQHRRLVGDDRRIRHPRPSETPSVLTEVSVPNANDPDTWTPAGDDTASLWTYQKYDWKGRVVRKINTDGIDQTTLNDTDTLISYDGCGCAGGQQTTIEGERVPVPGTSSFARRKQKAYEDILGRAFKTETYEWDGTTVYSTAVNSFNGRDQVTQSRQYAGSTSSSTFQDTTATYDGHGRLASSHKPEQQNPVGTAAYTTYNYNTDDSISSVMDARGASMTYSYNNQKLPVFVQYSVPQGSSIEIPSNVVFAYDALGNRTSMTDGLGSVAYAYNSLSQMTSETRHFNDVLTNGLPSNNYQIQYAYDLGRQLKSMTEPFGATFNYSYDKVGRPAGVDPASAYGDLPQNQAIMSGMQYRAFGSMKQADNGNGTQTTMSYNNRLQPSSYRLKNTTNNQILFGKDYYYTTGSNNDNDGRLKRSVHYDDTVSTSEKEKNNRYYEYDGIGRMKSAKTGEPACYTFGCVDRNGPFQQTYHYNAFGKLTGTDDWDFGFNTPSGGPGCYGCPRFFNYSESTSNNRTSSSVLHTNDPAGGQTINTYRI